MIKYIIIRIDVQSMKEYHFAITRNSMVVILFVKIILYLEEY